LNFSEEIQTLNPWVKLITRVRSDDSNPYVHFRTQDYVAIIALHEEKLALVKQFRIALNLETIELPSGLIEFGQTPMTAALVELEEEVGLIPDSEPKLLPVQFIDSSRLESRVHPYFISSTRLKDGWNPEPNLERFWMEKDEIANAVKFGKLTLSSHSGMLAYLLVSGDL
jgi:8-oxo-dGTP pyrophosphatase MutT (NUDIX family)